MAEIKNAFAYCRQTLTERLAEPAPGRIQILTAPDDKESAKKYGISAINWVNFLISGPASS
jgi:hypothetical protein